MTPIIDPDNYKPRELRAMRVLLGLSREQLAVRSGVSYETIRNMETGRKKPWLTTKSSVIQTINRHLTTEPIIVPDVAREIL